MSLNQKDLVTVFDAAKAYLTLVEATTITWAQGGAIGGLQADLAKILNRAYDQYGRSEQPGMPHRSVSFNESP